MAVPLDTIGRNVSTPNFPGVSARVFRWLLLGEAATLLPFEAVAECCRQVAPTSPGVAIHRDALRNHARYGGLVRCHSVWHCSMCSMQITDTRRGEIELASFAARDQHILPRLVTYTCQHHKWSQLPVLLAGFTDAVRKSKMGRAYQRMSADLGFIGTIRSLEVTYGGFGWNPHSHELLFAPEEVSTDEIRGRLWEHWAPVARKHGLVVVEDAFDVRDTYGAVGDYVAKYGRDPVYDKPWGVSAEMTRWHIKKGRGASVTPFQLLAASLDGDRDAGSLFVDYARAFKGRRQLFWSQGLEDMLGINRKADSELVEPGPDDELLGYLSREDWRKVKGYRARGELLEVAAAGGWDAVREWVAAL